MDPTEKAEEILDRIREIVGEHVNAFVFTAEVPCGDGTDSMTIWTFSGGQNACLGLATRVARRLEESGYPGDDDDTSHEEGLWV
ncbi:MAG: hypothetical protein EBR82_35155 [Caulobacteraceae bacterium]|nr:hypothetical protein [Caulobacteraceae bacterium]